jgi:parallel beta-helix repeat protein
VQVLTPGPLDKVQAGHTATVNFRTDGLTTQTPVARIDVGGAGDGPWAADTSISSSGGEASSVGLAVDPSKLAHPIPQDVLESYVWAYGVGSLNYSVPVPDGQYTVRLYFVAPGDTTSPTFSIRLQGTTVLANYDLLADAGGLLIATEKDFDVTATGGLGIRLQLFSSGGFSTLETLSALAVVTDPPAGTVLPTAQVDLSADDGGTWTTLATSVPIDASGQGSFGWVVPAGQPEGSHYRVRVTTTAPDGAAVSGSTPSFQIANGGHSYYVNDGSTAGDVFTTAAGNDANSGKGPAHPMATLPALLTAYPNLTSADTIYVDTGNYALLRNAVLTASQSGVHIVGPATGAAILNRGNFVGGSYAVELQQAANVALDHLQFTGGYAGVYTTTPGFFGFGTPPPGSTGLTLSNSTVSGNGQYGVFLDSASGGATLTGNTVFGIPNTSGAQQTGLELDGPQSTVAGNTVFDNASVGIRAQGTGTTVSGNEVFGNNVGISGGAVVSGNRVHDNSDAGILAQGFSTQVLGNRVYSNGVGILASTSQISVVGSNVVYANTNNGILLQGGGGYIVNNTVYQPGGDAVRVTGFSSNVTLRNNILWVESGYDIDVASDSRFNFSSDSNLLHTGSGANAHVGFWGSTQDGLADWQAASGQDARSGDGDPSFVDRDGADNVLGYALVNGVFVDGGPDDNFYLAANSPAIDRGDSFLATATDAEGFGRHDDPGTPNQGTPDYVAATLGSSLFSATGTAQHWTGKDAFFTLTLPFAFPYFGTTYTSLSVFTSGYLSIGVSPLQDNLEVSAAKGNDIYVDTSVSGQVTVRWQATNDADGSQVNFDVVLFQDGHVRFDYGPGNTDLSPTVSLSNPVPGLDSVTAPYNGQKTLTNANSILFGQQTGFTDLGAYEFRGSSPATTPPTVAGTSPRAVDASTAILPTDRLQVTFSEDVNPIDANAPSLYELRKAGSGGFGSPDDVVYVLTPHYTPGNPTVTLDIGGLAGGKLPEGTYRLTITSNSGASIHDLAGLRLDGDGDGTQGGNYVRTFAVVQPPLTLTSPGDQASDEGAVVSLQMPATAATSFSASGLPKGLSIDPKTGRISGTIDRRGEGSYTVTVSASDGVVSTDTSFAWAVADTTPPAISDPGPQTGDEGAVVSLQIQAIDADRFSAAGLPDGLTIDGKTGLISGTLTASAPRLAPYAVTVTAYDGEVSASLTFNWTVTDATLPTLTKPAAQTNNEGDGVSLAMTADDVDSFTATGLPPGLQIDPATGTISGTIDLRGAGAYHVKVTALDSVNSVSVTFDWTVNDTTPPALTAPPTQVSPEGATVTGLQISAVDAESFSATGLPAGLTIDPKTGVISGVIGRRAEGSYTVQVTALDGATSSSVQFTWRVNDTTPPDLTNPGDQTSDEGQAIAPLQIVALDADRFGASGLPTGLSIDPATGIISGKVDLRAAGTYNVTVTALDGEAQSTAQFQWTVNDTTPPQLFQPFTQFSIDGSNVFLRIAAIDAESFTATGLPPGLQIDDTGLISGLIGANAASSSPYTVTVTGHDSSLSSSVSFTWVVFSLVTNPGDQVNNEGDSVVLSIAGQGGFQGNPNGGPREGPNGPFGGQGQQGSVTYSATGLPPGLSIVASQGLIVGTINQYGAGHYAVTVSASNGQVTDTTHFNWTVIDIPPADLGTPGAQTNDESDAVRLDIGAISPGASNFQAAGLPPGLKIDSGTGVISGTIDARGAGNYTVIVAADVGTTVTGVTFSWTVNDTTPPVLATPTPQSNSEGDSVSLNVGAGAQDAESFSATGLPPGLGIDNTGLISGTIDRRGAGDYTVTVTASDGTVSTGVTFGWVVAGTTPPDLANPGPQASNESDPVHLALAVADAESFTVTNLPPGLTLDSTGLISGTIGRHAAGDYPVTVTAHDGTLTTTITFDWVVADTNPPDLTNPGDQSDNEGQTVALQIAAVDADSFGAAGLPKGLSIDPSTGLISGTIDPRGAGSYPVTVTALDGDLQASMTFTWIVADTTPPALTQPADQTNDEGDVIAPLQVVAVDADSFSATGLPKGLTIDPATGLISGTTDLRGAGSYTVTVTATDDAAQSSTTFHWTVNDTTPPEFTLPPDQVIVRGDRVSLPVSAIDADGFSATGLPAGLTIDPLTGLISGTVTAARGAYRVTMTATDGTPSTSRTFTLTVAERPSAPVDTDPAENGVPEGAAAGTRVGITAFSTDPTGAAVTYRLLDDAGGRFAIDPRTGVVTVASGAVFDFEHASSHRIVVEASDGTLTSTQSFFIPVEDVAPTIDLSGNPTTTDAGAVHVLTVPPPVQAAPDSIDPTRSVIHWGDGQSSPWTGPGTYTHTYGDALRAPTISVDLADGSGAHLAVGVLPITVNPNSVKTPPVRPTTVSVFDRATATWQMRDSNTPGAPTTAPFRYGSPSSVPVLGDWTGSGSFTIGVVDVVPNPYPASFSSAPRLLRWQLKDSNNPGAPDVTFLYGKEGDIPVVGDWDGNGTTTIGIFEPDTGVWKLKNINQEGAPDHAFAYGVPGDLPVVGDWDGDGTTTIGVVKPATMTWWLRNSNSAGPADITPFAYGSRGDVPVTGNWTGGHVTTIGVFEPVPAVWKLRTSNSPGAPDITPFAYGTGGGQSLPVFGHYGTTPQLQAGGGPRTIGPQSDSLSQAAMDATVRAALTRLAGAGVSGATLDRLAAVHFAVGDLVGSQLAESFLTTSLVFVDRYAAGHGWFVDATPLQDEEFTAAAGGVLSALPGTPAAGREDLLSAVLHEMWHLAFLQGPEARSSGATLTGDELADGARLTAAITQIFAQGRF